MTLPGGVSPRSHSIHCPSSFSGSGGGLSSMDAEATEVRTIRGPQFVRISPTDLGSAGQTVGVATETTELRSGSGPGDEFSPVDWALFMSIALIWGSSFLLIAIGLETMHPGVVTLLRVGLGALALNVIPGSRARFDRADQRNIVALSIVWVAIPFTLFPIAEQYINSAVTGLLNGGVPIFTALFGALFFGRRTTGPQLLGVAVGFVGVALISLPSASEGGTQLRGVLLVVAATMCYGVATNLAYPLQLKYGSRTLMARMLLLATVWTLPYGMIGWGESTFEAGPLVAVIVLGVVGTGVRVPHHGHAGRTGRIDTGQLHHLPDPGVSLAASASSSRTTTSPALALVGVVLVVAGAFLASRAER